MGSKPKVLIVDDAPENLHLLVNILKDEYAVTAATSGEKALESARKTTPDVALLDVLMPGMDGYEVCRRLKSDDITSKIGVIFITSNIDDQNNQQALSLGAAGYMAKPVNPEVLKAKIAELLRVKNEL